MAIIILRTTRCQYCELRPMRRQAREKMRVPEARSLVRDNFSYNMSDMMARNTAEKMNTWMKAGPARTLKL